VVDRRDVRRYLVGDRSHWSGDRLESWNHPWKCGLRTPDEYALWFGGGYLFGVAMRPVRVEARAFETFQGYPIWQAMDESAYAGGR